VYGGDGDDYLNGGDAADDGIGGPGVDQCVLIERPISCES
jgi:hypothetical protein